MGLGRGFFIFFSLLVFFTLFIVIVFFFIGVFRLAEFIKINWANAESSI